MDIDDKQDEILEYEDGDAPMGTDTVDADIILVDEAEGDAEMVDDAEVVKQDDNDDTPMLDDADAAGQPTIVEETMVEETEIVMQPAEEEREGDSDGDTPMREDGNDSIVILEEDAVEPLPVARLPQTNVNIAPPQQQLSSEETISMSSPSVNWPPQPTDVPPVPSLLPSALAVPQDIKHQEGKIHDATHHSSTQDLVDSTDGRPVDADAASIIAEPDATAAAVISRPPTPSATQPLQEEAEKADDASMMETRSNYVEPAGSVRESDFDGTGITGTAPNSVAGDAVEDRMNTSTTATTPLVPGSGGKWPPAPTEVPAVPSLLPSALAVPDHVHDGENGVLSSSGREGKLHVEGVGRGGKEESESVVAEPAGSVRAAETSASVRENGKHGDDGVEGKGEEEEDDASSVFTGKSELGDGATGGTGTQQISDLLPPIIIVITNTRHQPLFAPLPAGVEYSFPSAGSSEVGKTTSGAGWDTLSPILPDLQAELADAPMSELFMALRVSLGEEFAAERGKELVIYQEELGLKVGEDNKHAEQVTLNDIIQLHTGCGCPQPVVLHLEHDSQRFISRYEAIRKILADAREDGEEEALGDEEGEGETVYIDAYDEDDEDDELAYEDHEEHEHHEEEEDELAQDTTADDTLDAGKGGAVPANRQVTEEILEYEEDEGTTSAHIETVKEVAGRTTGTEVEPETETDQFGVDAAIRAAEQAAISSLSDPAPREGENNTALAPSNGVTSSTKRPLEEGAEQGGLVDGERQVKRKLSPEVDGGNVEA